MCQASVLVCTSADTKENPLCHSTTLLQCEPCGFLTPGFGHGGHLEQLKSCTLCSYLHVELQTVPTGHCHHLCKEHSPPTPISEMLFDPFKPLYLPSQTAPGQRDPNVHPR